MQTTDNTPKINSFLICWRKFLIKFSKNLLKTFLKRVQSFFSSRTEQPRKFQYFVCTLSLWPFHTSPFSTFTRYFLFFRKIIIIVYDLRNCLSVRHNLQALKKLVKVTTTRTFFLPIKTFKLLWAGNVFLSLLTFLFYFIFVSKKRQSTKFKIYLTQEQATSFFLFLFYFRSNVYFLYLLDFQKNLLQEKNSQ